MAAGVLVRRVVEDYDNARFIHLGEFSVMDYQLAFLPQRSRRAILAMTVTDHWTDEQGRLHISTYKKTSQERELL